MFEIVRDIVWCLEQINGIILWTLYEIVIKHTHHHRLDHTIIS